MANWIAPTIASIEDALAAPEVAALRDAVLGDSQSDPVGTAIASVVPRVRGFVASRPGNKVDQNQTLVPPELFQDTVWLVIQALKARLGFGSPFSDDQRTLLRRAEDDLKKVATGDLLVSPPQNPEVTASIPAGSNAELVAGRTRLFGDMFAATGAQELNTLAGAGITDGVSKNERYIDPPWLVSFPWNWLSGKPTTVVGSGLTDAVSTAALTAALASFATLGSPNFTGTPTVPTATAGTNTTQAASTAFVRGEVAALLASAPAALDTLNELAAALGNDPAFATTVTNALALKAPLASPAFTGIPTVPTAVGGTNTTQIATTAYVRGEIASLVASAPAALDTLNELAAALGNDASFATTVTNALALKSPLASPTFTGTPLAPTAAVDTNTTQLATTAFVVGQGYAKLASPTFIGTVTIPSTAVIGSHAPSADGGASIGTSISAGRYASGFFKTALKVTGAASAMEVWNTDAAVSTINYEKAVFDWVTTANWLTIGTKAGGTGSLRGIIYDCNQHQWYVAGSGAMQLFGGQLYPIADIGLNLGSGTNRWNGLYVKTLNTNTVINITSTLAAGWSMLAFTDNSNSPKWYMGYGNASAASLAGLPFIQTNGLDFAFYNNSTELFRLNLGGGVLTPKTIVPGGTTGAQTINKMAGSVNFAAGATSLVVTNSLVTANSVVVCQLVTADATAVLGAVTKASGSFTINMKTAPTAETRVDFYVATT